MAADQINDAGGVRVGNTIYKFKICFADDMKTASGAVKAIQQLLYEDKVHIINSVPFVTNKVVLPYLNKEKVITFTWDTGDIVLGPENPYVFRIHFDTRINNMIVLDWMRQNTDLRKFEIVNLDLEQFTSVVPVEKKVWEEWGLDVHYTWYDWTTKDFYPIITAALHHHPEAILISQSAGCAIMQQSRELGFEGQFILPEMLPPWYSDLMTDDELEGLISMTPADDNPEVPQAYKNYWESHKARYGFYPYASKLFTDYTFVYVAAALLKAAGSIDSDKFKEVMETQPLTLEFPEGATMTIQFSGKEFFGVDHNWQPNQYIAVFENGKICQKATIPFLDQVPYLALIDKYKEEAGGEEYVPEEIDLGDTEARKLTADSTIGALLDNPDTRAILEKHIPEVIANPELPVFLCLRSLFSMAGDRIDQTKLPLIEADLEALHAE